MLEIVTIYKTSRGLFRNRQDAELKSNRGKVDDINDPNYGKRESVTEVQALTDGTRFYQLNELTVG